MNSIFLLWLFLVPWYVLSSFDVNIQYINSQPVIALDDLLNMRKDIVYQHISDHVKIHRALYPLSINVLWWMQDPIMLPKRFILHIPQGRVYSKSGFVIVNDLYIYELLWELSRQEIAEKPIKFNMLRNLVHVEGKVVVLTQPGTWNYYHWMTEILPKLAMLEECNISYDYLYLPCDRPYMRETLSLLDIDLNTILDPAGQYKYICADELIVPSLVSLFGHTPRWAIDFLRNKFIPIIEKQYDPSVFPKRIFISRSRAKSRKIVNEDEVFQLFKKYGFVLYNLEDLSVLEQMALFYHAEFIAGEHGAGLTNIIFAQPHIAQLIEIFQAREDATYWYLSQEIGLQYHGIKTIEFDTKATLNNGFKKVKVDLEPIEKFLNTLFFDEL